MIRNVTAAGESLTLDGVRFFFFFCRGVGLCRVAALRWKYHVDVVNLRISLKLRVCIVGSAIFARDSRAACRSGEIFLGPVACAPSGCGVFTVVDVPQQGATNRTNVLRGGV